MSVSKIYPPEVPYRPPRPRGDNNLTSALGGAILGLLLTDRPAGALGGALIGSALGNQPMSLEAAIRAYFVQNKTPVVAFYRLGPKAAMVLFRFRDQFWTLTSHAPDSPSWTTEDLEDWLYGDLIQRHSQRLAEINSRFVK